MFRHCFSRKRYTILCLGVVLYALALSPLYAERLAVGVKFVSFSLHPKGSPNAPLMPLKFVQGLYGDCALQFLGYTHLGFRLRLLKIKRFSANVGIGPTLIYRQSWFKLKGYDTAEKFLKGNSFENWEYAFIWYGGEFECNFRIKDAWDMSLAVIPAGFDLINLSTGFRYRFWK